jgi:phosphohistidine phosphatase SixA
MASYRTAAAQAGVGETWERERGMTRLCLVRHAHADWQPDEGRPLSARGRHDAVVLARLPAVSDTAALYSSPARRAVETITSP